MTARDGERVHQQWIREPTKVRHGIRVVEYQGTAWIETIDDDGEERQSLMVEEDELDDLIEALIEVSNRHAE